MPYRSLKQERYFNAHKKELEAKGVNVNEWNQASKGLKLPEKSCSSCKAHKSHSHQIKMK